ncbi:unnamed protein product, partial [marine sediment metagenome]
MDLLGSVKCVLDFKEFSKPALAITIVLKIQ